MNGATTPARRGSQVSGNDQEILRVSATLAQTYPLLIDSPGSSVEQLSEGPLPPGPRRAFLRGRIATYRDLGEQTDADLQDIPSVGYATLAEIHGLCRAAQERWDRVGHRERPPDAVTGNEPTPVALPPPLVISPQVAGALDLVAQWAATTSGATTWGEVRAAVVSGVLPSDVAAALNELAGTPTGASGDSPVAVLHGWLEKLDLRERDVVESRIARRTSTLDELGRRHGVTRERIRQVESRLRSDLKRMLEDDTAWRPVRWAAHALRDRSGACSPLSSLGHLDPESLSTRLLLLAGRLSTTCIAGSVTYDDFRLPRVEDFVLPPDGVLVDEDSLRTHLEGLGVRQEHFEHVIGLLAVQRLEGQLVVWRSNIVDRSVAQLAAHGEPMGSEALLPLTGGASERGLRNRLLEDPRLHRVNREDFALRSWGMPEYTSVVEHMLDVLDEVRGSVWLEDLAQRLQDEFDIKKGTTISYAAAPVFVVHDGLIWRRHEDEPYPVPTNVSSAPGLYRLGDRRVSWLVAVDRELARGSGRPAPPALGGLLGVRPGEKLTMTGPSAPVTISWNVRSHMGPGCSTLRQLMQDLGAFEGDLIRLELDALQERYVAERVLVSENRAPLIRLRELTGIAAVDGGSALRSMALALEVSPETALNVLERRGDDTVAALVRDATQEHDDNGGTRGSGPQEEAGA